MNDGAPKFVLAALSFALDWSANHLLNPAWHGHARFHGALLLFLLAGVSLTGVWLLWRDSKEPDVAVKAAALISASFWTLDGMGRRPERHSAPRRFHVLSEPRRRGRVFADDGDRVAVGRIGNQRLVRFDRDAGKRHRGHTEHERAAAGACR